LSQIANAGPQLSDWGFEEIQTQNPARASRLSRAGTPEELAAAIVGAFRDAIAKGEVRLGIDGLSNDFTKPRAIAQFHVGNELYDWYFNARSGYRGRHWMGTEIGQEYNVDLLDELRRQASAGLTQEVKAHRIVFEIVGASRVERDGGPMTVPRDLFIKSLLPSESKIWICERRIRVDGGDPEDIGFAAISGSLNAKLRVPRWSSAIHPTTREVGEGLRAPFPNDPDAWLDIKGGFLVGDLVKQHKSPRDRARMIHEYGWT
jgi:hypothetical protein